METIRNVLSANESKKTSSMQPNTSANLTRNGSETYVTEYRKKYGTFEVLMSRNSFEKVPVLSVDFRKLLDAKDVPSFVRLDQTFGVGSSQTWLYTHLKQLVVVCGITNEKMDKKQIDALANVIIGNFPSMKINEFMLFESWFMGGRYDQFFGETSYFLTLTRSLQTFNVELRKLYANIEEEKRRHHQEAMPPVDRRNTLDLNISMSRRKKENPYHLQLLKGGVLAAKALLENEGNMTEEQATVTRRKFRECYGKLPEDFCRVNGYLESREIPSVLSLTAEERWDFCKEDLFAAVGMNYNRVRVAAISFHEYDSQKRVLVLYVPDKATYEYAEEVLAPVISAVLSRYFPGATLNYFIPPKRENPPQTN